MNVRAARILVSTIVLQACAGAHLLAQDRFPTPIMDSGIVLRVMDFVTLPDSNPGQPARVSVVTQDPMGRVFVNDQRGPLYRIDEQDEARAAVLYLDLRSYAALALRSGSEPGFQSFAFHPDFHEMGQAGYGRLYTIHSSNNTTPAPDFNPGGGTAFHTVLLEWRTTDPTAASFSPADPETPYREIMRLKQPFDNHNAGLIAFNPVTNRGDADFGNLYVAIGDGGSGGDPQENGEDPSNPFGAILRIDPLGTNSANGKYGIVAENALAGDGDPLTLGEIYCYGLRNPQRFGWDLVSGNLYIADIGQNAVEEINLGGNGLNFGWDTREGSFPFEGSSTLGLTDPVVEYDHTNTVLGHGSFIGNRAVTCGEVVRGACIPELEGVLLVSDFPTGFLFGVNVDTDPLDGGQDGLFEFRVAYPDGQPMRFLQMINAARAARGLSQSSRADTRFSVNMPGRIFISNKHDGIVRQVLPVAQPAIQIQQDVHGNIQLAFEGLLERSRDLDGWHLVIPQPTLSADMPLNNEPVFYRSLRKTGPSGLD